MWVALYTKEDRLWTVGHYDPSGKWRSFRDFDTEVEASRFIHYLNGGQLDDPHPDDR